MATILEVWNELTRKISEAIPECKVYRCYDVASELADIAADNTPRIYIQLEGVESTPIGGGDALKNIEDTTDFTINLIWKTQTKKVSEYDNLLPYVEKIAAALRYKKFGKPTELFSILNPSFGTNGELYDKELLTDEGCFVTTISVQTKSRRSVNG